MTQTITAMQKYESYKDSGIDWIGDIPVDWNIKKIKFINNVYSGNSLNESNKKKFESTNIDHLPYISSKDIDINYATIKYENGLRIPKGLNQYKVAPASSSLICIEGGSAGRKVAYTEQSVCFVNKLACMFPKKDLFPKFGFYLLKSHPFQHQFQLSMSGLIGGVPISRLNNFSVSCPLLEGQKIIANFLDEKTAQIDEAIGIKKHQIDLLKERKQIITQNAVTKGLNPKVSMKDSGIDWIGDIPLHWQVLANRALFSERVQPGVEGLPLLSVSIHSAVSNEELAEEENIQGRVKIEDKSQYRLVEIGDVVFNMMRAWQGAIGAVSVRGMVSPAYIIATPRLCINSHFFELLYRSPMLIQQMARYSKGITDFRKRLYWDEFKQLPCLVPPQNEQAAIVDYIAKESKKIEEAVTIQYQQIDKLKEYKASLINSAVTGKIKVI
jgi:type I restriction enzyme, S subunit